MDVLSHPAILSTVTAEIVIASLPFRSRVALGLAVVERHAVVHADWHYFDALVHVLNQYVLHRGKYRVILGIRDKGCQHVPHTLRAGPGIPVHAHPIQHPQ